MMLSSLHGNLSVHINAAGTPLSLYVYTMVLGPNQLSSSVCRQVGARSANMKNLWLSGNQLRARLLGVPDPACDIRELIVRSMLFKIRHKQIFC